MLGAKVKVPTPEGPVMLTDPQGLARSGKVLRLKGRGFTDKDGKRGDQLVALEVDLPAERRRARAIRRGLERRRQPARRARGLAARRMKELLPAVARSAAQAAGEHERAAFGHDVVEQASPGADPLEVVKRVAVGVYNDGFIHAGNLAYLALLALFPFFILAAAVAHLLGRTEERQLAVATILAELPPNVADVLARRSTEVLHARGPGHCCGSARSSGCGPRRASSRPSATSCAAPTASNIARRFWQYRLGSMAVILGVGGAADVRVRARPWC